MARFFLDMFVIYICVSTSSLIESKDNKRILLSDPGYVHKIEVDMQTLRGKIDELSTKFTAQDSNLHNLNRKVPHTAFGALYVRWGRSTCPGNGTQMVYSGYAGGSLYTDTGAAVEYVCMPKDPTHEYSDFQDNDARIYGAQYQTKFFDGTTTGQRAPCAVCRSSKRASTIMLPGKRSCTAGWTMEYHGIMATGYVSHKAGAQYVCLDADAEGEASTSSYDIGKLFYRVRSRCSALPCPPYVEKSILSCVVCSK